jgi:hypothetical protein
LATFEERAPALIATAAKIARLQRATSEATILETARGTLIETGYDNWNSGTTMFTLMLEVPIGVYAESEPRRDQLEKAVLKRVQPLVRTDVGNHISEVVIGPILEDGARPREPEQDVSQDPLPTFWKPGFFRLFITHLAAHRISAHRLKESLADFRVAAFVAHDDIEPTREWQTEIERALRTMDALAAVVTPGLLESCWCDQEVGFALGRHKLVVPLLKEADPHGFIAKHQGIQTAGLKPRDVAQRLVETLARNPQSTARMCDALVDRLVNSTSWLSSKETVGLLEQTPKLNQMQVGRIVQAIDQNVEVGQATKVPERLRALISAVGETTAA